MEQHKAYSEKAALIRKYCMIATTEAGSGHPTSCLSATDIMTVLFEKYFRYDLSQPLNLFNDRIIFSKGHAAPLFYTMFAVAGAYPLEELKSLRKFNSPFEGHPVPAFKYTDAATGSLGQGLSVAAGLALVAKREDRPCKSFVLLGDGELAEGQIWEAANFASYHKLNNLVVIADINRLAQSGETMFAHHMHEYVDRFTAFGFEVVAIDGHDFHDIEKALKMAVNNQTHKPVAIIAQTIKGKGVSFLEDKEGWHGKALNKEELGKALEELGEVNDAARFTLVKPGSIELPQEGINAVDVEVAYKDEEEYATREVFGEVLVEIASSDDRIYALDGDVKNSTFTDKFLESFPQRFVECFIAEQNMVSVAAGLARLGKIPVVATFAAFLTRAADQIRMARISEANIKFVGSHVGVSIGEDGPSQMGLEDIALFGALPDTVILQPADAISTAKLLPLMLQHNGFVYMRTLRPKTSLLYAVEQDFSIGGSCTLVDSEKDELTIAASGITVHEAIKAANALKKENIVVRVIDCYSISPVDKEALCKAAGETAQRTIISVEDHFEHGGLGDFITAAVAGENIYVEKMAVREISCSGTKDELLKDAGIDADAIKAKVKHMIGRSVAIDF